MAAATTQSSSTYDLTDKLIAHIDRHMVIPVLDFLHERKLYNPREVSQAKYDVLSQTKLVDSRAVCWQALNPGKKVPAEIEKQKAEVTTGIAELSKPCEPLLSIVNNADLTAQLISENSFTLAGLASRGVNDTHVAALAKLARFNFEAGVYDRASVQLQAVVRLSSDDTELRLSALWGKLASSIMAKKSDDAYEDLKALREAIDKRGGSDLTALHQRTWLIHWSLFVFPHLDNGKVQLIEWLMEPKLLNAIQVSCPHVLRYLTAAAIITKRQQKRSQSQKNVLKDTVRLLVQEKGVYSDPLTEFLTALYVEFDFDLAHKQLKLCKRVLVTDFVLHTFADEFLESARALIFETYCRIHKCIDVKSLSAKLEFKEGEAERKILELIRVARVDARIDTDKNMVIVEKPYPTVYQQVIDKTKSSLHRSTLLMAAIEKRSQPKSDAAAIAAAPPAASAAQST